VTEGLPIGGRGIFGPTLLEPRPWGAWTKMPRSVTGILIVIVLVLLIIFLLNRV
jgi:hypothetical protein